MVDLTLKFGMSKLSIKIRGKREYKGMKKELTKNEAKCSDVRTALKPTTGTKAANSVPSTTCIRIHTICVNNFQNSLIPASII